MEQDLTGLELQQQQETMEDQKKEVHVIELENSINVLTQTLKSAKAKSLQDNFKIKLQQKTIEKQNTELQQHKDEILKLRNKINCLNIKLSQFLPGELNHALPGELNHTLPGRVDHTLPGRINQTLPNELEVLQKAIKKEKPSEVSMSHLLTDVGNSEKKNSSNNSSKDSVQLESTVNNDQYQSAAIKLEEYVEHISEIENKYRFQRNEENTIDERFEHILEVDRLRQNEGEPPQTIEESFEQLPEMEQEYTYRPNDEDFQSHEVYIEDIVEYENKFLPNEDDDDQAKEENQFRSEAGSSPKHSSSSSFEDPTPSTSMKMEDSTDDKTSINKSIKNKKQLKQHSNKLVTLTPTVSQNLTNTLQKKKKSFECEQCQLTFPYQCHFLAHMEKVHQNMKPFQCPQCPKSFRLTNHCKSHFDMVHRKLNPLQCETCYESFKSNYLLGKHVAKVHEKKRKPYYKCEEWDCEEAFYNLHSLQKHMKLIHDGGEKTHICQ
jgi:hypothetical protein